MTTYLDKHGDEIRNYHIIDIHQTVNGENQFIVADIESGDIRYFRNPDLQYEYSVHELLSSPAIPFDDETDIEIVGVYTKKLSTIETKEPQKNFKLKLIEESAFDEIDFDLWNEILGDSAEEILDSGGDPGDYIDTSDVVDNHPIQIDKIINILQKMKDERGASYVEIYYHTDHIGYELRTYKVEELNK